MDSNAHHSPPELSLEESLTPRRGGNPVKKVGGYNPYDTDPPGAPMEPDQDKMRKQADLHKLSEWIRLTLEIDELKKEKR